MAEVAVNSAAGTYARQQDRSRALRWFNLTDTTFRIASLSAAVFVLLLLGGIIISLIIGAMPAFQKFGLNFLTVQRWDPNADIYGALAPIYGTIVTSIIAMVIAVPVGLGIAIFLTEICPPWLRRPIGIAIELLAGIPSIIYGIWGFFVFAPVLQQTVQPFLINTLGQIPGIGNLFAGPPYGIGILTAGLILAIMVLPFITSISRDVFESVPPVLKEAGYGLGCTTWEVVTKIVLPFITSISRDVFEAVPPVLKEAAYGLGCTTWEVARYVVLPFTRVGVIGGVMLGLGRALGETMAVTFVVGNAHRISASILAPGTTISATIANEFQEAVGDLYTSSLIALGLILFFITFLVLAAARYMLMRLDQKAGK